MNKFSIIEIIALSFAILLGAMVIGMMGQVVFDHKCNNKKEWNDR